jgi:hypothetical protein
MAEIVNLRIHRKRLARAATAEEAARRRVQHGRTRVEREAGEDARASAARVLDGHRLVRDGEAGE